MMILSTCKCTVCAVLQIESRAGGFRNGRPVYKLRGFEFETRTYVLSIFNRVLTFIYIPSISIL